MQIVNTAAGANASTIISLSSALRPQVAIAQHSCATPKSLAIRKAHHFIG
jgi:hypothetical protein